MRRGTRQSRPRSVKGAARGTKSDPSRYNPIGDYALIGDCHACALVSKQGAIDWACLARFDAGSVFGRILDAEKGGTFAITAHERTGQQPSLSTRYQRSRDDPDHAGTGSARILDCFTMRDGGRQHPYRQLLRVVGGD